MKKLFALACFWLLTASSAFAQLGSFSNDLVYTPITPCRIFDTRTSQGGSGAIPANGTKYFRVWDTTSFANQGGSPTNCGITAGVVLNGTFNVVSNLAAVAMNVTVVTPSSNGYVTVHPFGSEKPLAATVNFQTGDIARGDFTIAKINAVSPPPGHATYNLSVFSSSNTDVVGDVVGYFSRPVSTGSLECNTTSVTENFTLTPGYNSFHYTTSTCTDGTIPVSAYCYSRSAPGVNLTGSGINGGAWCGWSNSSGSSQTVNQGSVCCRIPGR